MYKKTTEKSAICCVSNTGGEKNKGSLWKVFRAEDGTKFLRLYLLISDAARSPHVIISHMLAGFGGERGRRRRRRRALRFEAPSSER